MTKTINARIGCGVIFKDRRGKRYFFVVKQNENDNWEIPKLAARNGESSVRASIRMAGEMAGINAKVLEEVGRASGATKVNGKIVPQKYYYYLMVFLSGTPDILGFADAKWFEYSKALRSLHLKREKKFLKEAKKVYRKWKKEHPEED